MCSRRSASSRRTTAQRPPPSGAAAAVLAALDSGATTADEVVRATGIEPAAVAAALTELELAGLVSAAAGMYRR